MKYRIIVLLVAALTLSCTKIIRETVYEYLPQPDTEEQGEDKDKEEPAEPAQPGEVTQPTYSIQSFGVLPTNTPGVNKVKLQKAIDWASDAGAALWVEPVVGGYPVASGITLKQNVSLVGVHGPTGRGTAVTPQGAARTPTGSLFVITDNTHPFITVESATQIRGIQFYYPEQAFDNPSKVIVYPPTIQVSQTRGVQGVTLSCLTFYGATFAMDFRAKVEYNTNGSYQSGSPCEQILFEHCYGYPLSGQFIAVSSCFDIPRILHCHSNPAVMREFKGDYNKDMLDYVVSQKNYTYWIEHTDNAQIMDIFTYGTYGGIYLGPYTYGQLTNFNFDCVHTGVFKDGNSAFNRVWEVAQGSIIANVPSGSEGIHPFLVQGNGHLSITNVDCFGTAVPQLTSVREATDYLRVQGSAAVTITGVNCRMRNYSSDKPITIANTKAEVKFDSGVDKSGEVFNFWYKDGKYTWDYGNGNIEKY